MKQGKVYFVSDVHLGSRYHSDPMEVERRFARWLLSIEPDAAALYLVGDIFDYWFEYKHVVPRGHTRFLGALATLSDAGVEIHFFTGNHDIWLKDYLTREAHVIIHREPYEMTLNGTTFFIAHGDEFDYRKRSFRLLRRIFHNRLCQTLYGSIHPRWTVGLAHSWSLSSRRKGLKSGVPDYQGEAEEYLVRFAKSELARRSTPIHYFIFGHRHILLDLMLTRESRIIILGDWLRYDSYAVWDGAQMELHSLREGE